MYFFVYIFFLTASKTGWDWTISWDLQHASTQQITQLFTNVEEFIQFFPKGLGMWEFDEGKKRLYVVGYYNLKIKIVISNKPVRIWKMAIVTWKHYLIINLRGMAMRNFGPDERWG